MVHRRLSHQIVGRKLSGLDGNRASYKPLSLREFLESFIVKGEGEVKTGELYERLFMVYKDLSECPVGSNPTEVEQIRLDTEAAWNTIQLLRDHSSNPELEALHVRLEKEYGPLKTYNGQTR